MEREIPPCACTIAGSDPSGGAGLQADLGVFAALGVHGLSVVTAVTAQNTRGVAGIHFVPPGVVALQIATLRAEFSIRAVKTGMPGESGSIGAIAREIPDGVPLVLDPVMVSTSGHTLLPADALDALVSELLPRATIVTPNVHEAEVLSGISPVRDVTGAIRAARRILSLGPEYVVIKGGHLPGEEATDILVGPDREWAISTRRYPYAIHGAGCCFSAALCAFLARGYTVVEAFSGAKEFMDVLAGNAVRAPSGMHVLSPSAWREGVVLRGGENPLHS
ncbi:MAG: bifunctional hydroxymethylpyrimidine kinase/phosphomethylpyrimidine kinase [Methanolinea sp.]|nr:bifunctional hydroxymethylpyrimidine kinase/phosphomethylpyrimidine kinase [Methanolinea sp.]